MWNVTEDHCICIDKCLMVKTGSGQFPAPVVNMAPSVVKYLGNCPVRVQWTPSSVPVRPSHRGKSKFWEAGRHLCKTTLQINSHLILCPWRGQVVVTNEREVLSE